MAPNGDLWLGTSDHLERIPAAALNQFGRFPGVSYPGPGGSSNLVCLHVSRDGALWVGTTAGLYRFADGSFSLIVRELAIHRIEEASNSHILAVTSAGFIEWDGSRAVEHPEIAAELDMKSDEVFQVLVSRMLCLCSVWDFGAVVSIAVKPFIGTVQHTNRGTRCRAHAHRS